MKVARLYRAGEMLRIEEADKPVADAGSAVVRVRAAGVCGTELHFLNGVLPLDKPTILGHEIAGDIESINGDAAFKPGDRVAVYNMMNCGKCEYCRSGLDSLCDNPAGQIGFNVDGGFAEYVKVPVESLVRLPDEVSYAEGAVLACSGMSAVHGTRIAGVGLGDNVVVNGVGGVGLMVIQVSMRMGARVIAVADTEMRAELAKKAGAEAVICSTDYDKEIPERIRELTGGKGANVFVELVGTTKTMKAGISSLAKRGRFLIIGYTDQDLVVSPLSLVIGELKIVNSVAAAKKDLIDVIELARRGLVRPVIEGEYPLDRVNEALMKLKERKALGRNVIVP